MNGNRKSKVEMVNDNELSLKGALLCTLILAWKGPCAQIQQHTLLYTLCIHTY